MQRPWTPSTARRSISAPPLLRRRRSVASLPPAALVPPALAAPLASPSEPVEARVVAEETGRGSPGVPDPTEGRYPGLADSPDAGPSARFILPPPGPGP